jgi:pyrroline-5-carboxylate reductase
VIKMQSENPLLVRKRKLNPFARTRRKGVMPKPKVTKVMPNNAIKYESGDVVRYSNPQMEGDKRTPFQKLFM